MLLAVCNHRANAVCLFVLTLPTPPPSPNPNTCAQFDADTFFFKDVIGVLFTPPEERLLATEGHRILPGKLITRHRDALYNTINDPSAEPEFDGSDDESTSVRLCLGCFGNTLFCFDLISILTTIPPPFLSPFQQTRSKSVSMTLGSTSLVRGALLGTVISLCCCASGRWLVGWLLQLHSQRLTSLRQRSPNFSLTEHALGRHAV